MGFWDIASKVGEFAVKQLQNYSAQQDKMRDKYDRTSNESKSMSNDELVRKAKITSDRTKKAAYASELKNRGYFDK